MRYRPNAKLQVPINACILADLTKQADKLGFDSVQAYVRYWARASVDGRTFAGRQVENISLPEVQALRFIELILAGRHLKPQSLEEALTAVRGELARLNMNRAVQKLGLH